MARCVVLDIYLVEALTAVRSQSWAVPKNAATYQAWKRLRYWGLMEVSNGIAWRISERGESFLSGKIEMSRDCSISQQGFPSFSPHLISAKQIFESAR